MGPGRLSKVAGAALPAFQKRIVNRKHTYLADLDSGELALAGSQKLSAQLQEICNSIGAKDLNSPVLKSFSQIQ
jgi:hypothetical protein